MDGSHAGIMMKADPRPGTPRYSQGYAPPPFNWTDHATVEKQVRRSAFRPAATRTFW